MYFFHTLLLFVEKIISVSFIDGERDRWLDEKHSKITSNLEIQPPYHPVCDNFTALKFTDNERAIIDKIKGSFIGLAVGDTFGAFYEWRHKDFIASETRDPVLFRQLRPVKIDGLKDPVISFTDDTSMALCLASSLIIKKGFDEYDQLMRYCRWINKNYMTTHGVQHGSGGTTKNSLKNFSNQREALFDKVKDELAVKTIDEMDAKMNTILATKNGMNLKCDIGNINGWGEGNGTLMRLAPVPLFYYRNVKEAIQFAELSSLTTHSGNKSSDICKIFAAYICRALKEKNITKKELIDYDFYVKNKWIDDSKIIEDVRNIAKTYFTGKTSKEADVTGSALTIETFKAVLWAFSNDRDDFEEGMKLLVKLGEDTDTTCAIYGQLAGAFYGFKAIPKDWLENLPLSKFFEEISIFLFLYGESNYNHALGPKKCDLSQEKIPNINNVMPTGKTTTKEDHKVSGVDINKGSFTASSNITDLSSDRVKDKDTVKNVDKLNQEDDNSINMEDINIININPKSTENDINTDSDLQEVLSANPLDKLMETNLGDANTDENITTAHVEQIDDENKNINNLGRDNEVLIINENPVKNKDVEETETSNQDDASEKTVKTPLNDPNTTICKDKDQGLPVDTPIPNEENIHKVSISGENVTTTHNKEIEEENKNKDDLGKVDKSVIITEDPVEDEKSKDPKIVNEVDVDSKIDEIQSCNPIIHPYQEREKVSSLGALDVTKENNGKDGKTDQAEKTIPTENNDQNKESQNTENSEEEKEKNQTLGNMNNTENFGNIDKTLLKTQDKSNEERHDTNQANKDISGRENLMISPKDKTTDDIKKKTDVDAVEEDNKKVASQVKDSAFKNELVNPISIISGSSNKSGQKQKKEFPVLKVSIAVGLGMVLILCCISAFYCFKK